MRFAKAPAKPADSIRAFVAICVPVEVIEPLNQVQIRLAAELGLQKFRWTNPRQLHLTLHFFGNVALTDLPSLQTSLHHAVKDIPAFSLAVNQLGAFPSIHRPRVLWAGFQGDLPTLATLEKSIRNHATGFGSNSENRSFQPHLTLGRARDPRRPLPRAALALKQCPLPPPIPWIVQQIHLFQSKLSPQGSTHTILKSFDLASSAIPSKSQPARLF